MIFSLHFQCIFTPGDKYALFLIIENRVFEEKSTFSGSTYQFLWKNQHVRAQRTNSCGKINIFRQIGIFFPNLLDGCDRFPTKSAVVVRRPKQLIS